MNNVILRHLQISLRLIRKSILKQGEILMNIFVFPTLNLRKCLIKLIEMNSPHGPMHKKVRCEFIVLLMQTATQFSIKYICLTRKPPFVE